MIVANNKKMFKVLDVENKSDRFIFGGYKIIKYSDIKETFIESKKWKTLFDGYHLTVKYGLVLNNGERFAVYEINDAPLSNTKVAKCVNKFLDSIIKFNDAIYELLVTYKKYEVLSNVYSKLQELVDKITIEE